MWTENRTLLIVDDEPETLKGYVDFLTPKEVATARKSSRRLFGTGTGGEGAAQQDAFKLLIAHSGEEALRLFEEEKKNGGRVAAGFFDVKLGAGMDGLALIHAIKSQDKDIHCVVVTAYHDRTVEEINDLFGEDFKDQWDYLNKPFTQGEIVQKARQMVSAWNRKNRLQLVQDQLVKSERMAAIGQVARGIGHEFGNILLRIMGKADLALMEKDPSKLKEHLEVILKASERAGVIVRNLQSFSKTERAFQHERVTRAAEEALSLVSHELVKSSVKLVKELNTSQEARIDVGGLAQVFLNLYINAVHAMPKGGTLTVKAVDEASPEGKPGVSVTVADTGSGIPPEVMPKIFEFAFTTKGDQGSGLGLALSKEIVDSHSGRIDVKTELGKGTEFKVWIPA